MYVSRTMRSGRPFPQTLLPVCPGGGGWRRLRENLHQAPGRSGNSASTWEPGEAPFNRPRQWPHCTGRWPG